MRVRLVGLALAALIGVGVAPALADTIIPAALSPYKNLSDLRDKVQSRLSLGVDYNTVKLHVANHTALRATATTAANVIEADGSLVAGDGGGASYYAMAVSCDLGGGAGDGGAEIASFDNLCWHIAPTTVFDPRVWEAYGDVKTLTGVAVSITASNPVVTITGIGATTVDAGKLITITDVIGGGTAAGPTYTGSILSTGLSSTPTDTITLSAAPSFSSTHTQEIAWGHDDPPAFNAMTAYIESLNLPNVGLITPEINFGGARYGASAASFDFQANGVYKNGSLIALGTAGLNCATAPLVYSTANGNATFEDLDINSGYLPVTGLGETTNAITFADSGLRIYGWAGTCGSVAVTASAPINAQVILVTSTAGLSTFMQSIGNTAIPDRAMIVMVESSTTDPNSPCPGDLCIVISKPTSAAISAVSETFYVVPHGFAELGANSGAHLDGVVIREYGYADSDHGTGLYIVSAASINANGSGYPTSETGTLTWVGDSCSIDPVLNASTDASGNVSITSVATAGQCRLPPDPSVESWQAGGGLVGGSGTTLYLTFTSQGADGDKYGCAALIQGNQSDVWRSVITGGSVGLCVDNTGNGLNVVDGQVFNVGFNSAEYNAPAVLLAAGAKKVTLKGLSVSGVVQDYVGAHNPELGVSLVRVNPPAANVTYGPLNTAAIHSGNGGSGWGASLTGNIIWNGTGCPVDPIIQVTTDSTGTINSFFGAPLVLTPGFCTTMPSRTDTTDWIAQSGGGLSSGTGVAVVMAANEFQVYAVTPAAISLAAIHFDPYAVVNATAGLNYVDFTGLAPYGTSGFGTCGSTYSFSGLTCSQSQQIAGQISGIDIPAYSNGPPMMLPGINLIGGQLLNALDPTAVLAANYTLQSATDCPRDFNWNNGSSAYTLTIPNSLPGGCRFTVSAQGSGAISISPASGATVNNGSSAITANASAITYCAVVKNVGGVAADVFCDASAPGILGPTYGGTGVNNGSSTITLGGALTLSGAFTTALTVTANTSLTLPTSGTLAALGGTNSWSAQQTFTTAQANNVNVVGSSAPANGIYRPATNTLGLAVNSTLEAKLTTTDFTVTPETLIGSSSLSGIALSLQNNVEICTLTPAAAAVFSCASDRALKKDFAPTGSALAWLADFDVLDFTMRSGGPRQTGVVAQEVQIKHSNMVHETNIPVIGDNGAPRNALSVDEPNPWKLVKGEQELQAEIIALKTAITELQHRLH